MRSPSSWFRDLAIARKISVLLIFVVLVSLGISACSTYLNITKKVEKMLGLRLEHIVRTGTLMVSGDAHQKVLDVFVEQEHDPLETTEFKSIREELRKIQKQNDLTSDIYTLIRPDWVEGQMMFLVMTPEEPYLGNSMPLHPKVAEVLDSGKPAHTGLYTDDEGVWVSAFAPIIDSAGKTVAVLEVDYRADAEVREAKIELAHNIAVPAAAALLISIVLGVGSGRQIARPVNKLVVVAKEVATGNLKAHVNHVAGDEIGLLASTFNTMIDDLRLSREKLEEYNRDLEKLVAERTADLREANKTINAMLDSLGQGFLVFNREAEVSPICSKASESLFETSPAQKPIWEVLKKPKEALSDWCQFLFDEPLPFDSVKSAGPKEFDHSQGLKVSLDYHPIRNEDGKVSGVVVVATDKTAEYKAQLIAEQNRMYSEMVLKIVKTKNQFFTFVNDARAMLAELRRIMTLDDFTTELKAILRYAHTLKGGAAAFSVTSVRDAAHHFEDRLNELKTGGGEAAVLAAKQEVTAGIEEIATIFETFIDEAKIIVGKGLDAGQLREIPLSDLVAFSGQLRDGPANVLYPEFTRRFIAVPIASCFEHFDNIIQDVADRQSKTVNKLSYKGGDIRVVSEIYGEVFASMVHAFRNAIDHGIETADIRQMFGKPDAGTIEIEFVVEERESARWLNLTVTDDGGGIDADKLRRKLSEKGVASAETETDEEIIQHVFDSGVSTKDQVSDISGRGVGMDAIKFAVESLGGKAWVTTEVCVGTKLFITMPYFESREEARRFLDERVAARA